jgi:hypothetical protein
LVFLDEPIFNEKIGWRYHGNAPVGDEVLYDADIIKGKCRAICSAMTLDGWLPCIGVKEGYFKEDDFFESSLRRWPGPQGPQREGYAYGGDHTASRAQRVAPLLQYV